MDELKILQDGVRVDGLTVRVKFTLQPSDLQAIRKTFGYVPNTSCPTVIKIYLGNIM